MLLWKEVFIYECLYQQEIGDRPTTIYAHFGREQHQQLSNIDMTLYICYGGHCCHERWQEVIYLTA